MPTLLVLRAAALLSVVVLLVQFLSAGQLLQENFGALNVHAVGAIVLHVTSGVAALAAGLHWRLAGGSLVPVVLALVVFGVSFAQAYSGSHMGLAVHVPMALVTTVGVVWLAAWAMTPAARQAGRLAR